MKQVLVLFIYLFFLKVFTFYTFDGIINYYKGSRPEPTHLAFMDGTST